MVLHSFSESTSQTIHSVDSISPPQPSSSSPYPVEPIIVVDPQEGGPQELSTAHPDDTTTATIDLGGDSSQTTSSSIRRPASSSTRLSIGNSSSNSEEDDSQIVFPTTMDDPIPLIPTEPEFIVVNPEVNPAVSPEAGSSHLAIVGNRGRDRLIGTANADVIRGRSGGDRLIGGGGDDRLSGGRGNDVVKGGQGDDRLIGAGGSDRLKGGRGDDHLLGLNGNDRLIGGKGDDVLEGGKGRNVLKGMNGDDLFVLHRRGLSIIQDYQDSRDRIALPKSIRFGALTFNQTSHATELEFRNQTLAILRNTDASIFTADDFVSA